MISRAPFHLEASEGAFSWVLLLRSWDVDDDVAAVFRALRRHEYGYGWEGLALHVLEAEMSDIADVVEFDCENVYSNPRELRRVLKSSPRDQWSEMFLPEG